MLRIIIAGGRDFHDVLLMEKELNKITVGMHGGDVQIISGEARGADTLGIKLARSYNANIAIFPAQWSVYGKSAGYKRNTLMADNADVLLAFWDGTSKGTGHMIQLAHDKGLTVYEVGY